MALTLIVKFAKNSIIAHLQGTILFVRHLLHMFFFNKHLNESAAHKKNLQSSKDRSDREKWNAMHSANQTTGSKNLKQVCLGLFHVEMRAI